MVVSCAPMSCIMVSFLRTGCFATLHRDASDAFDRVQKKRRTLSGPGGFKSRSTDAQTVIAGGNRIQFIFLIALIRLSTTPEAAVRATLFLPRIQLSECVLQLFQFLSRLPELALGRKTLIVSKVFGGFRNQRVAISRRLR